MSTIRSGSGQDLNIVADSGVITLGTTSEPATIRIGETSTPSAPAAGEGGILYTKTNGKPYWISEEVSETDLSDSSPPAMTVTTITSGTSSTITENGTDQLIGMDDYDPGASYRLTIPRPSEVPAGRRFQFWLANESSYYFAVQTSDSSDLFQTSHDLYNDNEADQYLETYLDNSVIFTIYSDGVDTWYSGSASFSTNWYGTDSPS